MRPLNLGETLDASIKIVRAQWRTFALVILVVVGPIQVLSLLITASTTDGYSVDATLGGNSAVRYSDQAAYTGGRVVIAMLTLVSYLLGTVACYRAVADTYLGRPTSARASLTFALRRLGPTLWLTLLFVAGIALAVVALILPAIWLAVAWSVAVPAMLVEGLGATGALRRSFGLTKGRWWATLGRFVVANILIYVVTLAVTFAVLLVALLVVDKSSFAALLLEHVGSLLGALVTTPLLAAVTVLVYFDLRVRKEGFDLALLAERMGGVPAEEPAPGPAHPGGGFGHPAAGSASAAPAPQGGWAPPVAPEPLRPPRSPGR
jgi:hypothetical protein